MFDTSLGRKCLFSFSRIQFCSKILLFFFFLQIHVHYPLSPHFVWEDCNFQTLFEINTYRKKNHEIEIIKKWHSLKDKLFFEINSLWRISSSSLVYINFDRFCRSVWSRKDFSNLPDILTVSVEKIFLDQRCIL